MKRMALKHMCYILVVGHKTTELKEAYLQLTTNHESQYILAVGPKTTGMLVINHLSIIYPGSLLAAIPPQLALPLGKPRPRGRGGASSRAGRVAASIYAEVDYKKGSSPPYFRL